VIATFVPSKTERVDTTLSFAIKPVISAVEILQSPKPKGLNIGAIIPARLARILFCELVTMLNFVIQTQKASASLLQRKFKIGYNKAATMIDKLEENGIIGPPTGNSKPREVLVQFSESEEE